jgi:hypothetical protein
MSTFYRRRAWTFWLPRLWFWLTNCPDPGPPPIPPGHIRCPGCGDNFLPTGWVQMPPPRDLTVTPGPTPPTYDVDPNWRSRRRMQEHPELPGAPTGARNSGGGGKR